MFFENLNFITIIKLHLLYTFCLWFLEWLFDLSSII